MKYPADHLVIHEEVGPTGLTTYYINTYYNCVKQRHFYFTKPAAEAWVNEYLKRELECQQ